MNCPSFNPRTTRAIVLCLGFIPLLFLVKDNPSSDVQFFYKTVTDALNGAMPYRDQVFEYPPYAFFLFLLPSFSSELANFQTLFACEILFIDLAAKLCLISQGARLATALRSLIPLTFFSVVVVCNRSIYLQRFDLVPATLTFACIAAFCRGN